MTGNSINFQSIVQLFNLSEQISDVDEVCESNTKKATTAVVSESPTTTSDSRPGATVDSPAPEVKLEPKFNTTEVYFPHQGRKDPPL